MERVKEKKLTSKIKEKEVNNSSFVEEFEN